MSNLAAKSYLNLNLLAVQTVQELRLNCHLHVKFHFILLFFLQQMLPDIAFFFSVLTRELLRTRHETNIMCGQACSCSTCRMVRR